MTCLFSKNYKLHNALNLIHYNDISWAVLHLKAHHQKCICLFGGLLRLITKKESMICITRLWWQDWWISLSVMHKAFWCYNYVFMCDSPHPFMCFTFWINVHWNNISNANNANSMHEEWDIRAAKGSGGVSYKRNHKTDHCSLQVSLETRKCNNWYLCGKRRVNIYSLNSSYLCILVCSHSPGGRNLGNLPPHSVNPRHTLRDDCRMNTGSPTPDVQETNPYHWSPRQQICNNQSKSIWKRFNEYVHNIMGSIDFPTIFS